MVGVQRTLLQLDEVVSLGSSLSFGWQVLGWGPHSFCGVQLEQSSYYIKVFCFVDCPFSGLLITENRPFSQCLLFPGCQLLQLQIWDIVGKKKTQGTNSMSFLESWRSLVFMPFSTFQNLLFYVYFTDNIQDFQLFQQEEQGNIHLLHLPESRSLHFLNWFPLYPTTQIPRKMRVESVEEIYFSLCYTYKFGKGWTIPPSK